jgi:hypothetical protein
MILLSFSPDEIAFTSRERVGNLRIVRWACSPRRQGDRMVISCAAMRLADIRQPCDRQPQVSAPTSTSRRQESVFTWGFVSPADSVVTACGAQITTGDPAD